MYSVQAAVAEASCHEMKKSEISVKESYGYSRIYMRNQSNTMFMKEKTYPATARDKELALEYLSRIFVIGYEYNHALDAELKLFMERVEKFKKSLGN